MKCKLKIRISKRKWKTGIVVYNSYKDAKVRQDELKNMHNIESIIVDELGNKIIQ